MWFDFQQFSVRDQFHEILNSQAGHLSDSELGQLLLHLRALKETQVEKQ